MIHSDGAVDSRGEDNRRSGLDNVAQLMHGHRTLSTNAFNALLFDEIDRFSIGQRHDDVLLVTVDMR